MELPPLSLVIKLDDMAIDYEKIALEYAQEQGYDTIRAAGEKDGFHYYHIDYKVRPRYLGPPHIIKINPFGKVIEVWDTKEINEAYSRAIKPVLSS